MIKMLLGTVAGLLCSAFSAYSAFPSFDITVAAGQQERKNAPVRVQFPLGQTGDAKVASVTLTLPNGNANSSNFGKITSTQSAADAIGRSRELRLGLRLGF